MDSSDPKRSDAGLYTQFFALRGDEHPDYGPETNRSVVQINVRVHGEFDDVE